MEMTIGSMFELSSNIYLAIQTVIFEDGRHEPDDEIISKGEGKVLPENACLNLFLSPLAVRLPRYSLFLNATVT